MTICPSLPVLRPSWRTSLNREQNNWQLPCQADRSIRDRWIPEAIFGAAVGGNFGEGKDAMTANPTSFKENHTTQHWAELNLFPGNQPLKGLSRYSPDDKKGWTGEQHYTWMA